MAEITVDNGYKHIRLWVDGVNYPIATEEIIESVSITYGCTDGSAPGFGATYSPSCTVTINSNDIVGNTDLSYIQLGAKFSIRCDRTTDLNFENMGTFVIQQPPRYTDDYQIVFSGDGMLGSVLANTKVDYNLMSAYTETGVITIPQALNIIQTQFGITVNTPDTRYIPDNILNNASVVIPMKSKAKKNWNTWSFKRKFRKINARDFLAGIAVLIGCNVVEHMNEISFVSFAYNYSQALTADYYFTDDSFSSGYEIEKANYAPKSMNLDTYATKKLSLQGSSTPIGYAYDEDCSCNNVYTPSFNADQMYNVNIDCQWIGRSFEAYYFSGDVDNTDSGEYEDATPIRTYKSDAYQYTPSSWDFSGENVYVFKPGNFVKCQVKQKNTQTQLETTTYAIVFIMEMAWNWNGTIDVQVSSTFNGEIEYKTTYTTQNSQSNTRSATEATRDSVSTSTIAIEKAIKMQIGDRVNVVRNATNDSVVDADRIDGETSSGNVNMFTFTESNLIGD